MRIRWKYFQGERTSAFTHLPINHIDHIDQSIISIKQSNQIKSNQINQSTKGEKERKEGRKEGKTLFQSFHLTLIKPLRVLGWSGFKLPPRLALYCAPRGNGGRNRWNDWGMAHGQTDFQTSYLPNYLMYLKRV